MTRPGPCYPRRRRQRIRPGLPVAPLAPLAHGPSPGGWTAPAGVLPGWNWLPPPGLTQRLDRAPRWVLLWRATPLIDRYACAWMWRHGAYDVRPPTRFPGLPPGGTSGVREPRQPIAPAGADAITPQASPPPV